MTLRLCQGLYACLKAPGMPIMWHHFVIFLASYPLTDIATHAAQMYEHDTYVQGTYSKQIPPTVSLPLFSTEILERAEMPGVGEFVAYKDGRIHCTFYDRTILNVSIRLLYASLVYHDLRDTRRIPNNNLNEETIVPTNTEIITKQGRKLVFSSIIPPEVGYCILQI